MPNAFEMRVLSRLLCFLIYVLCMPGCLSIGGKTYSTNENPETENRIAALESRVTALERVLPSTLLPAANSPEGSVIPKPIQQ
jgi:hypothetical protein